MVCSLFLSSHFTVPYTLIVALSYTINIIIFIIQRNHSNDQNILNIMAGLVLVCLERVYEFALAQWDEYNNSNQAGRFI